MSNKISEKYFTQDDFSQRETEVLAAVTAETGFVVEKEIFRGLVYDKNKVGSLIYKGTYNGRAAVLKLQGLKPEIDEGEIVRHFSAQNQSRLVRVPHLYAHQPWSESHGYGYLITEYLEMPRIFEMPLATTDEMRNFARFYQEYRTSALTQPWLKPEADNSLALTTRRIDNWRRICEHKKRLTPADYLPYLDLYRPLAARHLPSLPLVSCHGHLTANDIYCPPDGSFVVLSNLFWSYRPQWYDLAFNIWCCLMHIRDTSFSFPQLQSYIAEWLKVYRRIPVVKQDHDFDRKFKMVFLERCLGAILVDLGASDLFALQENQPFFHHLLGLNQQLFNHLAKELKAL